MLTGPTLNDRPATVLNVLLDEYLKSDTPVASDEIARSLGQKISSATVRNTKVRLQGEPGYRHCTESPGPTIATDPTGLSS